MLAKVNSAALYGIDALRVEVEIDLASGLPQLATVGLPEGAVKESKDRIRAAVKNCGYTFPAKRITINLAPADIKKEGSAYDLPMAIGILAAEAPSDKTLLDQYFLDRRAFPRRHRSNRCAARCRSPWPPRKKKFAGLILPEQNASEAAVVSEVEVLGVRDLPQVVEFLNGSRTIDPTTGATSTICSVSTRSTTPTSTTSKASSMSNAPWKSPPPAVTTSSSSARPDRAKPCSPNGCRRSCRI